MLQYRFLKIPVMGSVESSQELNQFLTTQKVMEVDRQLSIDGQQTSINMRLAGWNNFPASKLKASAVLGEITSKSLRWPLLSCLER